MSKSHHHDAKKKKKRGQSLPPQAPVTDAPSTSTPPTSTPPSSSTPDRPRGGAATWYEVLDVLPSAPPAELKRAYERALDLVEGRTIGGYFLLDPMAIDSARADIDNAWAVLSDPEQKAAYDRRLGEAATLLPTPSSTTLEAPISAHEPDEITPSDARALLGLNSSSSGEGVFATLPPQAPVGDPPTPAPETSTSTVPTPSTKPKSALKFLAPVVEKAVGPSRPPPSAFADVTRPVAVQSVQPASTAPRSPSMPPARPFGEGTEPVFVPMATMLPTAAMPAPTSTVTPSAPPASSTSTLPTLPTVATPSPMPGLFSLEGTEVNGQLLKRLREARGLSVEAMCEATKIRKAYLVAIEEQDLENLPARVYLRGFLTQIARVLRVDKTKLAEGYLAFVARYGK